MTTASYFAMAFIAIAGVPLPAQEAGADSSEKAVYAPQSPMSFGDASASHSWEMISVTGELEGKLNSATARVGDRVVLKTTEKVQTADGVILPRARGSWATLPRCRRATRRTDLRNWRLRSTTRSLRMGKASRFSR